MQVEALAIPDVKIFTPRKFDDPRGFFSETYSERAFAAAGIELRFVQDNHSVSQPRGVLRGLHYQKPPHAQDKLVRVTRGRIWDVAVDLRKTSPTFGKFVFAEISADGWNQILVPVGFAHGFVTLEPNTEVIYKVTDFYAPDCDRGIIWNDTDLAIPWPIEPAEVLLSDKDARNPAWHDVVDFF